MKRAVLIVVGLVVLAAVLLLPNAPSPAKAVAPVVPPIESNTTEYLIALPMPDPDTLDVPASLLPEQVTVYARRLTYKQAQPFLPELERLRAQGKIISFSVKPDLHAIAVKVSPSAETGALTRLANMGYVIPNDAKPTACVVKAAKALQEQVQALSALPRQAITHTPSGGGGGVGATSLIEVYAPPDSTYTYVAGKTTANTVVTIRLLRGSSVLATATRTTDSGGYYAFYPTYQSCPTSGYNWTLRPGDVVEVTVGTNAPVSTTVVNVSAWADPVTNVVAGATAAGRSVQVVLNHYPNDFCSSSTYNQTVATDASGAFTANFTAQVDFNRRASAVVYARDTNGNGTYAWFNAYRIDTYFTSSDFWGYTKPNIDFTASLSRTGSIISTVTGKSSASGYYYGYFSSALQSGDVIAVNGSGVSMQYTATDLTNVTVNPDTDQATGKTGPGRRVQAYFEKNGNSWPLATSCSYNSSCIVTTADGSGNFTLNAGFDLVRGDYAYLYVFDAEGNYQYSDQYNAPAIGAKLSWGEVAGYWSVPNAYLTIVLKDNGGAVKGSDTTWADSYDNSFYAYPGTIIPTDKIEVGDGVVTETMTVQNLTARLRSSNGHLTGTAYNDHLVAWLWDFQRDGNYWYDYCSETDVSGGAYDLTFSGAQVGAQDYSDVSSTGPDGHYTWREPYAFTVNAQKGSDYVWGYSETPYTSVTTTLKTGATTKAVYTTTSYNDGYYDASLFSGVPVTITQGDTVIVQTGDGNSASLSVPNLTVNKDAINNRVYGTAPANEPVEARLNRRSGQNSWSYYYFNVAADGSGNYSASFNGLYWWRDCSAVQAGHRCAWPEVVYYNAAGHSVWVEGPQPSPVGADLYESDNISTTASLYTGIQHHTFDKYTDTDWITFTVSASDVANNIPYHLATFNLGWGMGTRMSLYDTDGVTPLFETYGYENSGRGVSTDRTFTLPGTYYLEIAPPGSSYASYCDAVYDLVIIPERFKVYLPLITR